MAFMWTIFFIFSYQRIIFEFFFCNSIFFLHRLIEYIRQLINLYNKIETINLLGFFSHTLNYSLNRYEYASIISCFYQFPLIEKSVERIPFKPLFLSSSSLSKFLIFMLIDHFNYVIFLCFFSAITRPVHQFLSLMLITIFKFFCFLLNQDFLFLFLRR